MLHHSSDSISYTCKVAELEITKENPQSCLGLVRSNTMTSRSAVQLLR